MKPTYTRSQLLEHARQGREEMIARHRARLPNMTPLEEQALRSGFQQGLHEALSLLTLHAGIVLKD